ncbi:hypothetical protein FCIRC_206 [Fusarium circinatum]|uniref:Uncharacterized protein n=1 Tax=Fusarium circinatum TaxID=48490 RepID=A0A8H5XE74_FUSCI|nr:hypothetical protein FCIRC_206 [Fusarium circinatum]
MLIVIILVTEQGLAKIALASSKITATIRLGLGVIERNFFGKAGVEFWCVGSDGYSYDTAIDFKIPPTPQSDKNIPEAPFGLQEQHLSYPDGDVPHGCHHMAQC